MVDAGGRGLVVLLDALVGVISGTTPATAPLARIARDPSLLVMEREAGSADYAYEVQYLLDATAPAVDKLKSELATLGDSLVVVGAGADRGEIEVWNVHVHVNDVGAAIEAGIEAGRPHRISVTRFADQFEARALGRAEDDEPVTGPDPEARAAVVVAAGPGLSRLFADEGAVVVRGRAGTNPSTAEVLAAIQETAAGTVVVLPNDNNMHAVAEAAAGEARAAGVRVSRGAHPVAGAGARRARRARPEPPVRRRRHRDGRGRRRLPLGRADDRRPRRAHRRRPVPRR